MAPLDSSRSWLRMIVLVCAVLAPSRPALAAWPNSSTQPLVIVGLPGTQASSSSISDGSGGFFVAWADLSSGSVEEYAQHYDAEGNALWTPGGVALTTGIGTRGGPIVVADGTGGVVVSWAESFPPIGIRAQHLNAVGVPQWTAPGIRVAAQSQDIQNYVVCGDGAGGALFAWEYNFSSTDHDIWAQHLSPTGGLIFGASGAPIAASTAMQDMVAGASDGAGGVWILWRDNTTVVSDVYCQHLNGAGVAQFGGGFNPENFVPGDIEGLVAAPDGFGGVIATFSLKPTSDFDVEAMHVYPNGTWATTVVSLYAPGNQTNPQLASDGSGGAYIVWMDDRDDIREDVYGSHVTSYGSVAPGWIASGSPIATGLDIYQNSPTVTADGQGGAIVAWLQGNSNQQLVLAARFRPDGTSPPGWQPGGNPIMTKPVSSSSLVLSPTGIGGAFCVWNSGTGSEVDVVAQRIDAFGQIGSPAPQILSVRDVPNDQGGRVRVSWSASPLDAGLTPAVLGYQLWKQVPTVLASAALRTHAARLFGLGEELGGKSSQRLYRTTRAAAATIYWEYAGGVPAQQFSGYSLTAATAGDSVAGSNPRTTFMVQAVGNFTPPGPVAAQIWWDSAPDSGYSVDNLPPALPSGLAASWSHAGTALTWNANTEPDLATYRLYRGSSPAFVASPATRIASPVQTWYMDAGASPSYYRLTAVDIHGNESASALLLPTGITGVPDGLPGVLAFTLTTPNPARGSIAMRLDLPHPAPVSADIYDTAGRRISALAHESLAAGRWRFVWRGVRDDGSAVAAGLYFLRVQAAGQTWMERVTLLR